MPSRMNEFREFVNAHPLLRDELKSGKRTWQEIYEECRDVRKHTSPQRLRLR